MKNKIQKSSWLKKIWISSIMTPQCKSWTHLFLKDWANLQINFKTLFSTICCRRNLFSYAMFLFYWKRLYLAICESVWNNCKRLWFGLLCRQHFSYGCIPILSPVSYRFVRISYMVCVSQCCENPHCLTFLWNMWTERKIIKYWHRFVTSNILSM